MPLSEKALIARIRRQTSTGPWVRRGIGDDCSVLRLPPGHEALITTDFSLEGVHFRRAWHPADSVGHRCLTRGLSDIAAMGGQPIAAFLSLAIPSNLGQAWVDEFLRGLLRLARKASVTLAGGDTAESPDGILADIVVLGSVPKRKAVLRSGARPGDDLYVSGELGASATILHRLELVGKKAKASQYPRHFYPNARVALGRALRENKMASAMIDVSDGLSTDLAHICEESGVGAEVFEYAVPCAGLGKALGQAALQDALHGGDDYELLFTAPRRTFIPSRLGGVGITRIGEITRKGPIVIIDGTGNRRKLRPGGWEHFKK